MQEHLQGIVAFPPGQGLKETVDCSRWSNVPSLRTASTAVQRRAQNRPGSREWPPGRRPPRAARWRMNSRHASALPCRPRHERLEAVEINMAEIDETPGRHGRCPVRADLRVQRPEDRRFDHDSLLVGKRAGRRAERADTPPVFRLAAQAAHLVVCLLFSALIDPSDFDRRSFRVACDPLRTSRACRFPSGRLRGRNPRLPPSPAEDPAASLGKVV